MSVKSYKTTMNNIDFAVPETKRPPIYTAMKYWGKKPHNVWNEYISTYVPPGGVYLDPFAGSGMSGVEAIKAGRKAICLDINPLTTFVFDVYCSDYDDLNFKMAAKKIYDSVSTTSLYLDYFCYESGYELHNTKYDKGVPYEVCFVSTSGKERFERKPLPKDIQKNNESFDIKILTPFPKNMFRKSSAFNNAFLKCIGETYDCLFTTKNLAILSMIFYEIGQIADHDLKIQLLFAFIQTVHLCCKMCVPRSKKAKRDYSTSWGRSAYFSASRSMEMNPLLVFYNNCVGKQSVSSALSYLKSYVGKIKGKNITNLEKIDLLEDYNLWYGIKDSKQLSNFLGENVVDFVLTDPPYGGLVPYLDLSYIWLAWLELYDPIYKTDYNHEISVNLDKSHNDFRQDMAQVISQIAIVSKPKSKMVLTFNNKDPKIWGALLRSIIDSGYSVERVIHQQNLRSGESNVVDKYGTSATDFYIRCVKKNDATVQLSDINSQEYICKVAEEILESRGEPTPYQILFNGIIVKLSNEFCALENCDSDLMLALRESDRFYTTPNTETLSGDFWWIRDKNYVPNSCNTLTKRVDDFIREIFTKINSIEYIELLKEIYKNFPNELSPDSLILEKIIMKYANKKGLLWQKK